MSAALLDRYRKLFNELLILREAEGGELPDEQESSYVERLDKLWWKLSEAEQQEYEAELAHATPPEAAESLELVDCVVAEGGSSAPRQAAA